jgi:hypothetical protein
LRFWCDLSKLLVASARAFFPPFPMHRSKRKPKSPDKIPALTRSATPAQIPFLPTCSRGGATSCSRRSRSRSWCRRSRSPGR